MLLQTGKYRAALGGAFLSSCSPCPSGKYSSSGATSCTSCPPGTFSSVPDQAVCTPCPAGTSSNAVGSVTPSLCIPCKAGNFVNAVSGATSCVPCQPGKYSNSTSGATISCSVCSSGSYSYLGNTSCLLCDAGSYAPSNAAVSDVDPCLGIHIHILFYESFDFINIISILSV